MRPYKERFLDWGGRSKRRPYIGSPLTLTLSIDPLHSEEQRVPRARVIWCALDESSQPVSN